MRGLLFNNTLNKLQQRVLLAKKGKRLCTASLIFFSLFFGIIFNRVNKINNGMNNRKTQLK